jgi:Uma2 family endonuclease
MAVQEKLYTAEDLWALSHLPENADKRLELSEGVLIEMSPAGLEHGVLAGEAFRRISNHVYDNKLGYVSTAETGYILYVNPDGKDTVRAPDVGFVRAEHLPEGIPTKFAPCAPDLAVEVVSRMIPPPISRRVADYMRCGTRLLWLIYPRLRTAVAHTPDGARIIERDGVLDGRDVLPGFSLPLVELFAVLDPPQQSAE